MLPEIIRSRWVNFIVIGISVFIIYYMDKMYHLLELRRTKEEA